MWSVELGVRSGEWGVGFAVTLTSFGPQCYAAAMARRGGDGGGRIIVGIWVAGMIHFQFIFVIVKGFC